VKERGDEIEGLPDDLLELVARERNGYDEYLGAKAAALAKIELAITIHGMSGGTGGGTRSPNGARAPGGARAFALGARGVAAVAIGSLIAGAGAGFVLGRGPRDDRSITTAATSTVAAVQPSYPAPPQSAAPSETAPAVRVDDLPPAPSARPATSASSRPLHANDLTLERELLDVARAALARGNPDGAIASLRRHVERWPNGLLAEEREVVWIQALVAGGRRHDADERGGRFRRDYPGSALTPAVDAALTVTSGDRRDP
jgi:TolA-binding protein